MGIFLIADLVKFIGVEINGCYFCGYLLLAKYILEKV